MKLFGIDWKRGFLAHLPTWDKMSLRGRRTFLDLRPSLTVKPEILGDTLSELVKASFVKAPPPRLPFERAK